MDPWANCQTHFVYFEPEENIAENILTKFEDNFEPVRDKLPDHEQYLAILESKLRKLKSDPNIFRQLAAKKESCMQQLLSEEPDCNLDQIFFEEPLSDSALLRSILPQKQALNQGEVVEFIKYDQLLEGDDKTSTNQEKKGKDNLENHRP